jgi:capsular polysaccharide transport system permease protein
MAGRHQHIIEEPSLGRAARIQLRVIGALVMREVQTRYGRKNLGAVWLFLEPMILGGCIGSFHLMTGHSVPGDLEVFAFYVIGYTPYYLFRAILNRAAIALEENHALLYHSRVTLLDIMIARHILEGAAVTLAVAVFLVVIATVTGNWPYDPVQIAAGIMLMTVMCHGFALIILAATRWGGPHQIERFVHPFTYLTIPLTGAFFMIWWFPSEYHWALSIFPTVHIFEFIREGQFGPQVPYHYDMTYALSVTVLLNVFGMLALRGARRHLEV